MATGDDITPKKSLGQHWLTDELSLEAIVDLANISSTDLVLEIGPGTGTLTRLLTLRAKNVIAIELDSKLANYLKSLKIPNLTVENEDVLRFNFESLPEYKLVANIPYFLTGKIIRLISELNNRPTLVVLLVQKEIAERMTAAPGDLSVLGLTAQYFWQLEKGPIITRDKFDPPPKVDSQVIAMTPIQPVIAKNDQQALFRLIKTGFASKRKTIQNSLAAGYNIDKQAIDKVLSSIDIDPRCRPQTLNINQWIKILKILKALAFTKAR